MHFHSFYLVARYVSIDFDNWYMVLITKKKLFYFPFSLEKETAISVFYPREDMIDQGYTTLGYMKMQMVVAHGGRCAEHVVFGNDVTDGGKDDLEKITKVHE